MNGLSLTAPRAALVGALAVAALVLLPVVRAMAQDATESQGQGTINWSRRVITCTGAASPNLDASRNAAQARINTERAARVDATRNCLEVVRGVRVTTANVTLGAMMQGNAALSTQVEGVIRGFRVVATRYFEDGGIEVDIEVPIDGELTRAALGNGLNRQVAAGQPTGIIVDAKGMNLVAVLAPRILDPEGNEVYGASMVSAQGNASVAGYQRSLDAARADARVAGAPLVVRAQSIQGSVDVVVSAEDAQRLRDVGTRLQLFQQGRVVIVKD